MQTAIPECMLIPDKDSNIVSQIPETEGYNAVAIGPGLGTDEKTEEAFHKLLTTWKGPMVVDADALNILAKHPEWMAYLPDETIITPHPGEMSRLTKTVDNGLKD